MAKYNVIKSTPENDVAWVLQIIANELAEANRLNRKHIEWSHPDMSGKMLQDVKEDKADG